MYGTGKRYDGYRAHTRYLDEVKERFVRGEPLLFVDVRNPKAWEASDMKLPGAVRVPADNVDGQLDGVSPARMIVTYCT